MSDCVILLDHRVSDQVATRRLWISKYRGTSHGTNEYPFLIGEHGFEVLPITAASLDHPAPSERITTGVPALDEMLGGQGVFRGSTILVSGTAGTGKSTLAAQIAQATCRRGEKCLYFAFEESPAQIVRNMRSVGIDLEACTRKDRLRFHAARPTLLGLEAHLTRIYAAVRDFRPRLVIIDPITNLAAAGDLGSAKAMLVRLIDFLKAGETTTVFTSLTSGGENLEGTIVGVSSLVDTWILLRDIESSAERNRGIYVLKSRGTAHSNQIREFQLTPEGIRLSEVYLGPEGLLTGSARLAQETREKALALEREQELDRKRRALARRRELLEAEITAKRLSLENEFEEESKLIAEGEKRRTTIADDRNVMAKSRGVASPGSAPKNGRPRREARP